MRDAYDMVVAEDKKTAALEKDREKTRDAWITECNATTCTMAHTLRTAKYDRPVEIAAGLLFDRATSAPVGKSIMTAPGADPKAGVHFGIDDIPKFGPDGKASRATFWSRRPDSRPATKLSWQS